MIAWAKSVIRRMGRKPKSTKWEDVALATLRHSRHQHSWREGAEDRILSFARSLPPTMDTTAGIAAIATNIQSERREPSNA